VGFVVSLSVAAIHPPSALYREDQRFGWWVYAVLVGMVALTRLPALLPAAGPLPTAVELSLNIGLILPAILVVGVLRMTTVVTATEIRVWFGWIPTYRRTLPAGSVARVEVVQYHPVAEFGGWGVRYGRDGERVLNARGDRGVRLHLVDGSRLLIGSQRPEDLALAVEGARRPGI
jgi:hypothetical protein